MNNEHYSRNEQIKDILGLIVLVPLIYVATVLLFCL